VAASVTKNASGRVVGQPPLYECTYIALPSEDQTRALPLTRSLSLVSASFDLLNTLCPALAILSPYRGTRDVCRVVNYFRLHHINETWFLFLPASFFAVGCGPWKQLQAHRRQISVSVILPSDLPILFSCRTRGTGLVSGLASRCWFSQASPFASAREVGSDEVMMTSS